jgi:hypothetical protein
VWYETYPNSNPNSKGANYEKDTIGKDNQSRNSIRFDKTAKQYG